MKRIVCIGPKEKLWRHNLEVTPAALARGPCSLLPKSSLRLPRAAAAPRHTGERVSERAPTLTQGISAVTSREDSLFILNPLVPLTSPPPASATRKSERGSVPILSLTCASDAISSVDHFLSLSNPLFPLTSDWLAAGADRRERGSARTLILTRADGAISYSTFVLFISNPLAPLRSAPFTAGGERTAEQIYTLAAPTAVWIPRAWVTRSGASLSTRIEQNPNSCRIDYDH
jgi:hypothetical protein